MSNHGRTAEDLSGLVFGRLTVIQREQNVNGRTAWLCRCSCGNEKIVITKYLKNGSVRSCVCLKYDIGFHNDYTGLKFGKLTVLAPTEKRDKNGSLYLLCQCDCGKTVDILQSGLISGNNTSCGCAREENKKIICSRLITEDGTSIDLLKNRKYRKDNKSGFRGVNKTKDNRYRVMIGFKGKKYHIGIYDTYTDAVEKRLEADDLIFNGYIQSKEHWDKEEPLIFEVSKEDKRIIISSNDPVVDGRSMSLDIKEKQEEHTSYYRKYNKRRPLSRKNVHI